ncbi:alpha/beta fold hydrolase [Stenotrophomonas sp. ISL-67]|uniref:alpha/beta fold hydrolase n=1 Tax=Stenotrophomonas sp. ISL-67 TaxID=2819171 RepID=UPI001BE7DBCC|nr:alpha/beta fold hydrolase [Stenotrophomonas sp. ISL-67]MBT2767297.1 alpha/beta fold hydrolase [Stenotrophomonas sp. ISL-67]
MSLLRAAMRVLGRISVRHAARWMDHLWFSAPRTRPVDTDQAWLDSATPLTFDVHRRPVAGWAWGDSGPTILLVHGWGGNAGQLCSLVAPLRRQGFRVVAFDAPAHGASAPSRLGGKRVTFFEMAEAVRVVAAREPALYGVVAHSGGCAVVALAMREGWRPPPRLAFIAPFALPSTAINSYARAISAAPAVVDAFRARVQAWLGHPWSYLDIANIPQQQQRPLLVLHDLQDKEVPVQHAQAILRTWPNARLATTRGLGHRRILRDAGVARELSSFMAASNDRAQPAADATPAASRDELDLAYESSGAIWSNARRR